MPKLRDASKGGFVFGTAAGVTLSAFTLMGAAAARFRTCGEAAAARRCSRRTNQFPSTDPTPPREKNGGRGRTGRQMTLANAAAAIDAPHRRPTRESIAC